MSSGVLDVKDGTDRRHRPTLAASLARVVSAALKEGIVRRAPDRIVLAAHLSRADLPAFRDFPRLKLRFDSPRKTYATTTKPALMTLPLPSGPRRVSVTLVDTMLLAPAGQQSLKALGAMLGMPKLELPPGAIERMRAFRDEDPQLFNRYASRDAEIAARYTLEVWRFLDQIGAIGPGGNLPPTIGAAAVNLFRSVTRDRGIDLDAALGYQRVRRRRVIAPEIGVHLVTYAECYHGGRNEAFRIGYTQRTTIYDVDLCGAYTTALAHVRVPDWAAAEVTHDVVTLTEIHDGLGFARVRFRFPPNTRFPSLPLRADRSTGWFTRSRGPAGAPASSSPWPSTKAPRSRSSTASSCPGSRTPGRSPSSRPPSRNCATVSQGLADGAAGQGDGQQPLWQSGPAGRRLATERRRAARVRQPLGRDARTCRQARSPARPSPPRSPAWSERR